MYIGIDNITKFFPYESVFIGNMFLKTETKEEYEDIKEKFSRHLNSKHGAFNYKTPKYHGFEEGYCRPMWDNKVTFEVSFRGLILYYQFYDGKVLVSTSIRKRNFDPSTHFISFEELQTKNK